MEEKYFLSVSEAIKYFGIGKNRFREFLGRNKDADFILMNGNKILIKRKKLEEYFNQAKSL